MKKYINIVNTELFTPLQIGLKSINKKNPIETFLLIYHHFSSDSLYRNSIYLMLSTAIMAFFGFFFWIIVARLYTPEQVGIATTLISVMALIAGLSNLGLNAGLVRFLFVSKNKNELINSSFIICSSTAVLLSVFFLIGLHIFSPKLLFLRENPSYAFTFIIFSVALANNMIIEALFVAYRSAKYVLVKNSVISLLKLLLAFLFVFLSAFGIFTAVGIANIVAISLSVFILIRFFNLKFVINHNLHEIRKIGSYSFGNYIAGFIASLPTWVLPIIITNNIGAAESGYFYIALMTANLLFIIPQATTQSLFAEGSQIENQMNKLIIKSVKIIASLLIPGILLIVFLGNKVLLVFGESYSAEAISLLQIMAFSGIFVSINSVIGTILKVKNRIKELICFGLIGSIAVFVLSNIFINFKLTGLGTAWLLSQSLVSFIYFYYILKKKIYT